MQFPATIPAWFITRPFYSLTRFTRNNLQQVYSRQFLVWSLPEKERIISDELKFALETKRDDS
jgi:hypothetical protein